MKNVKKKTAEDMFAKGGRTQKMPKMKMGVHKSREEVSLTKGSGCLQTRQPRKQTQDCCNYQTIQAEARKQGSKETEDLSALA